MAATSDALAWQERWSVPAVGAERAGPLARIVRATTARLRSAEVSAVSGRAEPVRARVLRVGRGAGALADKQRFEDLYFRTSQRALVFLTRRTADPEIAADLWGETWARAYEARDRYRGSSPAEEEAWLFGIARNVLAGYYKRGSAEQRAMQRLGLERPVLDDADLRELERLAGLNQLRNVLEEVLRDLSSEQRHALSLRVVRGLPYNQVAQIMGVSEETARARVSRGLRALAQALEHGDIDLSMLETP